MLLTDSLLLDYKRCQRRAFLNLYGDIQDRDPERDFLLKLRQESQKHIASVLREYYPNYQEPQTPKKQWQERAKETQALMEQGADCIYNGCLSYGFPVPEAFQDNLVLLGHPHLLLKQSGDSRWGDWSYFPVSIQLGRRPKPEYKVIAAFYGELLELCQGRSPSHAEIILRRHNTYRVDLEEWRPRLQETLGNFIQTLIQYQEPEVFISRQRCSLCHWHGHCYGIAQSQQHLSLVPGVTPSRYESLQTLGVMTIASLATTAVAQLEVVLGKSLAFQLQRQALSLLENRPLLNEKKINYPLPQAAIELYFDIEAEPERNLDYLLGVVVVDRKAGQQEFYGFFADTPAAEQKIWQDFLDLVNRYPLAPIFHFSEYEVETIKRLTQLYGSSKRQQDVLLRRCWDLHHYVVNAVILPVESYSLKSLANWMGFQWRDPGASGDQSVCWYDQWLESGDRHYRELILRYNEDDCRATWLLKDWLTAFLQDSGLPVDSGKRTTAVFPKA